jgi:hypothetical protein
MLVADVKKADHIFRSAFKGFKDFNLRSVSPRHSDDGGLTS